ncbi:MAG: efflux transporter periplasmic adaptor subunit, partial [Acidobacteria bacterium]|nr:efflux transporter periplasmic adaptor subunit [Acidobacteriota bacterium]
HVFVLESDESGALRARQRIVQSGPMLGDDVLIESGLQAGEQVAANGSFKLYEGVRVALAADTNGGADRSTDTAAR